VPCSSFDDRVRITEESWTFVFYSGLRRRTEAFGWHGSYD
jgi:hypothetical protein